MKIKKQWEDLGIKVILQPTYFSCAFKNGVLTERGVLLDYSNIWSVLSYPVGIIPIG